MLTDEQKGFYHEQGYLHVPGVFGDMEVRAMCEELDWVFDTWANHDAAWQGPWREKYMSEGERSTATLVALNDMHLHSELWARIASDSQMVDVVSDLIGSNVELHHTTLHAKPPEVGSPFPLHQDHAFFGHTETGYVDAILHLDSTPLEAGCLRFVPGSHKQGPLDHVRDGAPHLPTDEYRLADTVPVPVEVGDVVFFHLWTIHGSDLNHSGRWRRAVRFGYRDPANPQVDGHALGRFGWMVRGRRPKGDVAGKMVR